MASGRGTEVDVPVEVHVNARARESEPRPGLGVLNPDASRAAVSFHTTIPGYEPTPLVDLAGLASFLGIHRLWIKDESQRFGLNAFKVLGASYAIGKLAARHLGLDPSSVHFPELTAEARNVKSLTFATATDGNHGRAVAWTARMLGCPAVVYLPAGTARARVDAIEHEGAKAIVVQGTYDDAVRLVASHSRERGWTLLQDTAWPGYEEIPALIMEGYTTLVAEAASRMEGVHPTHVMVQAGVGSLASGILAAVQERWGHARPHFTVVEPVTAAPFFLSARAGDNQPKAAEGDLKTIMAGLACGEASTLAWPALGTWADAFAVCQDDVAHRGMRVLGNPLGKDLRIISGESGAVTTGMLFELCTDPRLEDARRAMALGPESRVLLFSTEGDTDPLNYRQVVWGEFFDKGK
jgi:diaminopropionate ammonia-lyase